MSRPHVPNDLVLRVARRFYRMTPERVTRRLAGLRSRLAYSLHTRGLTTNRTAEDWFVAQGRPVSIVIPSYNDLPFLTEALRSVEETCRDVDYEVIIVDDFIDPAVQDRLLLLQSDRVRVILKGERRGFAGTVNIGMAAARHDIVLLNSDVVAQPGWLQSLQHAAYGIHARMGIVSAKLVYPDGGIQYGGTYYARLLAPQWFGHLHVRSPAGKPTANVAGYNTSASGACMYITRATYNVLGGLDDEFWLGFEDVDYGLRAWQHGIRCYYEPSAMLIHYESASRGYSQGHRELASMRRFWRRWQEKFLRRRLPDGYAVDFVRSGQDSLWDRYVENLAVDLGHRGHAARIHTVDPNDPDALIDELSSAAGIVVACGTGAAETVWLAAALGSSAPVYLLPSVESEAHPTDPALQAEIIAGYRSDFDFVAPNRWTARQLQAETAWESTARVAPALAPGVLPEVGGSVVVSIGATPGQRAVVETAAKSAGLGIEHRVELDLASLDDLIRVAPRAVVDFREHSNSLEPYRLMSLGAVYVTVRQPRLSHEVLDGYNALQFDADDEGALARAVQDATTRDVVSHELRANGHASAQRAAEVAREDFAHALDAIALSVL